MGKRPSPRPAKRCTAQTKVRDPITNEIIRLRPCRAYAINGGTVCVSHGGNAPQVKRAAQERLKDLAILALDTIAGVMADDSASDASKVAAANSVLDRVRDTAKVGKQEISGPDGAPIAIDDVASARKDALRHALKDRGRARDVDRAARALRIVPDPNQDTADKDADADTA